MVLVSVNVFVGVLVLVSVNVKVFVGVLVLVFVNVKVFVGVLEQIQTEDFSRFMGQRVVIKGCGDEKSDRLSLALLVRLQPVALSILYGEPCSTVPIYKKGT